MTRGDRGFLLLMSHLGDSRRRPMTGPQMRLLTQRMAAMNQPGENRALTAGDLTALGYEVPEAERILALLAEEEKLDRYLLQAREKGCVPVTRADSRYPVALRKALGGDAPGCLWAKGDLSLLDTRKVSLVGSRELGEENWRFAARVGREAARAGFTLVSGNARGADQTGQDACLQAGGRVISIVADDLTKQKPTGNLLYLSEEDFGVRFSSIRALSRNRCIHALGEGTFVAQSGIGKGGTWDGTRKNLRSGWSPVFCFRDGSESNEAFRSLGASLIEEDQISLVLRRM